MELRGRLEMLPAYYRTKEKGPDGHWKVMDLCHPNMFNPFSKSQTNPVKPSLTPHAWISICVVPSPPLFFSSSLEQILSTYYVTGTFWLPRIQQQTKQIMFWYLCSKGRK